VSSDPEIRTSAILRVPRKQTQKGQQLTQSQLSSLLLRLNRLRAQTKSSLPVGEIVVVLEERSRGNYDVLRWNGARMDDVHLVTYDVYGPLFVEDVAILRYYYDDPAQPYLKGPGAGLFLIEEEPVPDPYIYGLWAETQMSPLKSGGGKIRATYEAYYPGYISTVGAPASQGAPGTYGIIVDDPEIFFVTNSVVTHCRGPLTLVGSNYVWTLRRNQTVTPAQTGSGSVPDFVGYAFYDPTDKILTLIPNIPPSATPANGNRTLHSYWIDPDTDAFNKATSTVTGYANQPLSGSSASGKHLVSFCNNTVVSSNNEGRVIGLERTGTSWARVWIRSVRDFIPTDSVVVSGTTMNWQCIKFPSNQFNFSPPFFQGRFWHAVSAFFEDRGWSDTTTSVYSPRVDFHSRLIDVGVDPATGSEVTYVIKDFPPPETGDMVVATSIVSAVEADLHAAFSATNTPEALPIVKTYCKNSSTGVIDPNPRYTLGPATSPTYHVGFGGNVTPNTASVVGAGEEIESTTVVGAYTKEVIWEGTLLEDRTFSGAFYSAAKKRWNGKPVPLPYNECTYPGDQYTEKDFHKTHAWIPQSPYWGFSSFLGHESCRVALDTGESWQMVAFPVPVVIPGYGVTVPRVNSDGFSPANFVYDDPVAGTPASYVANTHGFQRPRVISAWQTCIVYSPAPGSYQIIPVNRAFSGAAWDAYTCSEEILVPENGFQLIAWPDLNILFVLRTSRDSIRESYPLLEARELRSPATVLWSYKDLMPRTLLTSDIMDGASVAYWAGESTWSFGTIYNSAQVRPAMRVIAEPDRALVMLAGDFFSKRPQGFSGTGRVEYRVLQVNRNTYSVVETQTSTNGSSWNGDARLMNYYNPANSVPRAYEVMTSAVAMDQVFMTYTSYTRSLNVSS